MIRREVERMIVSILEIRNVMQRRGLSYFEARYMATNAGKFLSADPVFLAADDETWLRDPQMQNAYAYARNNPIKYVDPDGEFAFLAALAVVAVAVEVSFTAWDVYDAVKTVSDPSVSNAAKAVTVAGAALGVTEIGGGYGTAGRKALELGANKLDEAGKITTGIKTAVSETLQKMTTLGNNVLKPTQTEIDLKAVEKYYDILKSGGTVSPIDVLDNNGTKYILDGHHRYIGGQMAGVEVPSVNAGSGGLGGTTWDKVEIIE